MRLQRDRRRGGRRAALAAGLLVGGFDPILHRLDDNGAFRFVPSASAKDRENSYVKVPTPVRIPTPAAPKAPAAVAAPAPAPVKAAAPAPQPQPQPAKKDPNDANGDGIPDNKQGKATADDANGDGIPDSKQGKATTDDANGDGIPDSKQGGSKSANGGAARPASVGVSSEPPATIAEWWKRVTAPPPPPVPPRVAAQALPPFKDTVRNASGKVVAPTATKTATEASAPATTAKRPLAKPADVARRTLPAAAIPLPPAGTYRPNELVAVNLPASSLKKAQDLGFKLKGSAASAAVPTRVTTLIAPPSSSSAEAQALLRDVAPNDTPIALNRIYRLVPTSPLSPSGKEPVRSVIQAQQKPCAPDRCYGPTLIGWSSDLSKCARNLKIGVIDTFVDSRHPTFAGQSISWSETHPVSERTVESSHGTGVLSVLAGSRRSGTPGLIPDATFVSSDIFFADADGSPMSDTASLLDALKLMETLGVDIINMSVAGPRDKLVEDEIDRLARRGVIVVAAAGNEGPTGEPSYPAAYKNVIAVTAVNKDMSSYRYATRGDYIDVAAPGVEIWTAVPGAKEGFQTGTSFAVPYATAVVASVYGSLPKKSKETVLAALPLRDLGAPGRDPVFGRGLIGAPSSCQPQKPAPQQPSVSEPVVASNRAPEAQQGADAGVVPVSAGLTTGAIGNSSMPASWSPFSTLLPTSTQSVGPAAKR